MHLEVDILVFSRGRAGLNCFLLLGDSAPFWALTRPENHWYRKGTVPTMTPLPSLYTVHPLYFSVFFWFLIFLEQIQRWESVLEEINNIYLSSCECLDFGSRRSSSKSRWQMNLESIKLNYAEWMSSSFFLNSSFKLQNVKLYILSV